jgi:hypothetical protein
MTTARTIIRKAMQKSGILTKNETPSDDEANDGLDMLNDLVGEWSNSGMNTIARTTESFTVYAGNGVYTIGPTVIAPNFTATRPIHIVSAYLRLSDGTDQPVVVMSDDNYALITQKNQPGQTWALNLDNAYPTGTIRLFPVPDQTYTLFLVVENPLGSFATLDAIVDLAPGWEGALIYNLGCDMAPDYGQPISAELAQGAKKKKKAIEGAILRAQTMDGNPTAGGFNNVYTGYNR